MIEKKHTKIIYVQDAFTVQKVILPPAAGVKKNNDPCRIMTMGHFST